MTDYEIISILHDLRVCKHVYAKYSESQYEMAIQYAINKIRSYNDLQSRYMALVKEYADFNEYIKHHSPVRDNF